MAGYYCPECDITYPKHKQFSDCPVCEGSTKNTSAKPISDEDARAMLAHRDFKQWCEDNDRVDERIQATVIFKGATAPSDRIVNEAFDVIAMLEKHFPHTIVGELHVV